MGAKGGEKVTREQERIEDTLPKWWREREIRREVCSSDKHSNYIRKAPYYWWRDQCHEQICQRGQAPPPPTHNVNHLSRRPPKVFRDEAVDITFTEDDAKWVHHLHNDALAINVLIRTLNVHMVFIDNGSSVNILYYNTFQKIGLTNKDMSPEGGCIYGFICHAMEI